MRKRISSAFNRAGNTKRISNNQDTGQEVYWPMDLLPHDFPNIRVFTYGYDSKITHWFKGPGMQLDIYSYGESLLNGLEARRRADPDRPLIFIVHSLGGLILKDVSIEDVFWYPFLLIFVKGPSSSKDRYGRSFQTNLQVDWRNLLSGDTTPRRKLC